jgi:hypothetical protein
MLLFSGLYGEHKHIPIKGSVYYCEIKPNYKKDTVKSILIVGNNINIEMFLFIFSVPQGSITLW